MNKTDVSILYGLTALVFFLVDLFWLGVVAKKLYGRYLGHLMAPRVNWPAAVVFYCIYIAGLLVFAIIPGLKAASVEHALVNGGLFGFFTYATYDLTNLATLKEWPVVITVIDIAWGAILTATVSFLTVILAGYLGIQLV